MWQLQNFDIDDFLANYWQKKPVLLRQAIPGLSSVLSPEELAGLACEEGVHSRLVIEKDADTPWKLRYGPFKDEDFTSLPLSHYSLLVSECEKWLPELQQLVDLFNFIPKWRMDDLMISYAPESGSVGPHIDEYDVFLIQAAGQRHWSIANEAPLDPALIPDLDLAIMQEFEPDREWVLEAGDILYLPPKIAHHGVAVGDGCMTYSMGFRAPSAGDIMDSFLLEASERKLTDQRYSDVPLDRNRNPAEITGEDVSHFRSMIQSLLDQSASLWPDIVGKLVSDSTLSEDVEVIECADISEAAQFLWQKHPDSKIYFYASPESLRIFYNGQVKSLQTSVEHKLFCHYLCSEDIMSIADIQDYLDQAIEEFIMELISTHTLIPVFDDD
jgi:50S ribosomal protein L16 3-hydroxylase